MEFLIRTPLISLTKAQTMRLADELGILEYLLEKTVTCYRGVEKIGCRDCPACHLRNQGIVEYLNENSELDFSYKKDLLET